MATATTAKPLAQHMAESIPLECCDGATAVVEVHDKAQFLAGATKEHTVRCSKCLRLVKPVTRTTLQPNAL